MENNKFTNFNYRLVNSTVDTHEVVEVTYLYNNKARRRFIFINKSPKTDYIKEANKIVAKEIENGRFLKLSKRYGARSHLGRNLLIATAATFGVTAVGLAGYTTYRHFASHQEIQEVVVSDVAIDLKALNESSSGDEIKKAREEYNNLPPEEQAQIPQEIYDNLVKQEEAYRTDENAAKAFDEAASVSKLNETSDFKDFETATKLLNNLTPRAKKIAKTESHDNLLAQTVKYNTEKDAIDLASMSIRKIDETTSGDEFSKIRTELDGIKTSRPSFIAILGDYSASSNEGGTGLKGDWQKEYDKYVNDRDFANKFKTEVNSLKEDAGWEDINPLLLDQVKANLIKRKDADIVKSINDANKKLKEVTDCYDAAKKAVAALQATMGSFTEEECTNEQLTAADTAIKALPEVISEDFGGIVKAAKDKLAKATETYNKDKDSIASLKTEIENFAKEQAESKSCSQEDIKNYKTKIGEARETVSKHGDDFKDMLLSMNDAINEVQKIYNGDKTLVDNFVTLASAENLNKKSEESAFTAASAAQAKALVVVNTRQNDTELKETYNSVIDYYEEQVELFEAEKKTVKDFTDKVKALADQEQELHNVQSSQVEDAMKTLEGFVTERESIETAIQEQMKILQQKVTDEISKEDKPITKFEEDVKNLNDNKETCTGNEIDTVEKTVLPETQRGDMLIRIKNAQKTLEEVKTLYNRDVSEVSDVESKIAGLKADSDLEEINKVKDALDVAMEHAGKRTKDKDLSDRLKKCAADIDSALEKYMEDDKVADGIVNRIDYIYKDDTSEITQNDINRIVIAYNEAEHQRSKDIADAKATKSGYGIGVLNAVSHIQLEYNLGKDMDAKIGDLPESFTTVIEKIHFLSIYGEYQDIVDNYKVAPKAISSEKRSRIADLAPTVGMETAYKAKLNGSDIDSTTEITTFDSTYGYVSGATVVEDGSGSYAHVISIDSKTAQTIKDKYSSFTFLIYVDETSTIPEEGGLTVNVEAGQERLGYTNIEEAGKFIQVTATTDNIGDGDTIEISIQNGNAEIEGHTCKITYIAGTPKI